MSTNTITIRGEELASACGVFTEELQRTVDGAVAAAGIEGFVLGTVLGAFFMYIVLAYVIDQRPK